MKKLLLATAVAALSVSAAHAAPTVYGKAFLTLDYKDVNGNTTAIEDAIGDRLDNRIYKDEENGTSLNSVGSRIGLKGAEGLTANTDLVYQLEYGVKVDDNDTQFKSRDTYLGFSNKQYGTLLMGRLTTIDDQIQYANQASGKVIGGNDVLATITGPRANNTFEYFSPTYNGMTFMAMYGLDSDKDRNSGGDLDEYASHDQYGVGVKYEPANQPFKVGATYMGAGDALNTARVNGTYNLDPSLTVGGQYQFTDFDTNNNENAFMLSAAYKTATPWTIYSQADMVTDAEGSDGFDKQRFILGGQYAFNGNTVGHVYGAYINADSAPYEQVTTQQQIVNNTIVNVENVEIGKTDYDGFGIGTGIEYKF